MATTSNKLGLKRLTALIILVLVLAYSCSITQAQNVTTFAAGDKFAIPELNSTISFAVNGSYSAATLENNTWTFNDLRLNATRSTGNLKISAENSNVKITFYRPPNSSFLLSAILRYTVEGQGKQTINLGLNSSQRTNPGEWNVIVPNGVYLGEGSGWSLLPDNTVIITVATSNVTLVHYNFRLPDTSNQPFYQQHSIVIITAIVLAITVTIATVIKVKVRK